MAFSRVFISISLILIVIGADGQKVKYKDLFPLLNNKQYTEAEPFLKKFLKENPDHANALLYMGIIFQDKASKGDVLKQTEIVQHRIDSAVIYYDKAYKEIDEKEIKRNDEYYEGYKRRDLRTGDFAIKLSDVQFDIEKRVQGLKERKTRLGALRQYLTEAETLYGRAQTEFKALQGGFPGTREFLLRSDDETVKSLNRLGETYDSSNAAFRNYKATSQLLGRTGYNQVISPQEIVDFKVEGLSPADFYADDLKVWDYKTWAEKSVRTIEKDVKPVRESLIAYDMELNKMREKINHDSIDMQNELNALASKSPTASLKAIDPYPLPELVFNMKLGELYYSSQLMADRRLKDSSNVSLHLNRLDHQLKLIRNVDSTSSVLMKRDLDQEANNYKFFVVGAYGTVDVLKSLVRTTNDFAGRERLRKQKEWENKSQALKWIVYSSDSVPLFTDETTLSNKYKLLVMIPEDHTLGLHYADSIATGYFFTITPSRTPDVKATFPVDKVNFTKRNLPILKGITTRDEKSQVYFGAIYSEAKVHDKFSVVIAKVYRTDGLAWSHTYLFDMMPTAMTFDPSSSELSVKTSGPTGDTKLVVIDKNGKQIQ